MTSTPDPLGVTNAPGEQRLGGGAMNTVLRVGNTVHRVSGPWSPAVHTLLLHLEQCGFDGAPRVLGFDDQGREVLSYVAGECAQAPSSAALQDDGPFTLVARLIRRYHDAVETFEPPATAAWQFWVDAPLYPEQDLLKLGLSPRPAAPRLRRFVDAYGLDDRNNFVELIAKRVWSLYATMRAFSAQRSNIATFWARTRGEHWLRAIDHITRNRDEWQRHIAN